MWGELFATRYRGDRRSARDVDYAIAVAGQVAAGSRRPSTSSAWPRLAYTDPLTGLANRRAIDDRLDAAIARHRERAPWSASSSSTSTASSGSTTTAATRPATGHWSTSPGCLPRPRPGCPAAWPAAAAATSSASSSRGSTPDHAVRVAEDLCRRATAALDEGVACGVASTDDPVGPVGSAARLFRLADAAQSRAKRSRARHPVVAGRGLPHDATVRLADGSSGCRAAEPAGDRRRVRSRRGSAPPPRRAGDPRPLRRDGVRSGSRSSPTRCAGWSTAAAGGSRAPTRRTPCCRP